MHMSCCLARPDFWAQALSEFGLSSVVRSRTAQCTNSQADTNQFTIFDLEFIQLLLRPQSQVSGRMRA